MSSSSSALQQEQQKPWTFSAYHAVALTTFVSALQAEVRCQQDSYDQSVEVLHASAGTGPTEDMLKLGIPLYATYEEQLQALQDKYALATLDTGALVALGPYRLLHTLKAHMMRIEEERRAGAVAAGNGGGVRKMRLGRVPLELKLETSIGADALNGGEGRQTPQRGRAPSMSVQIKAERVDDDRCDVVTQQQQQSLKKNSPCVSLSDLLTASTPAKAESTSAKGANVSSAGSAGAGGWGDGCPPSWMTLKAVAAESQLSRETYNGAYFIPFLTPTGAPIARYVSSSARLLRANSAAQSPSVPLPPLVAPANCGTKMRNSAVRKKHPAALSSQAHQRYRSVATSQANAASMGETPFLSQTQRAKITRMQEHVQFLEEAPPPSSPSKEKLADDRALQLWRRVWPRSSMLPADAEESKRQQSAAAAPPLPQHAFVRPTPAMVTALIRVAEQNYKRDCERCAAQQACLPTLLAMAESLSVSGSAAGTGGTGPSWQSPTEAPPKSMDQRDLSQLQDALALTRSKLDSAYAERMALFRELAEALREEAALCVDEASACETGELTHAAPSSTPHSQQRATSSLGGRKRSRRSRSTLHATRSFTSTDVDVSNADLRDEEQAVADTSTKSALPAASALELLRSSLADPTALMRKVQKARESLAFFSSETSSAAVTLRRPSQVASEETWDLPNGIIGINLPSLEHDRHAPELAEYLWPKDLDVRIRHELRGVVSAKSGHPEASSIHVALSAAQVQQLEEVASAMSTVDAAAQLRAVAPPVVVGSIMAHPKFVESGWLYVHGRGEMIVADVELN